MTNTPSRNDGGHAIIRNCGFCGASFIPQGRQRFAMTRIVKQPGVSGTPRPYRRSPAKYRAPASSTSARNARHASWDNSDAASANGFAGV